MNEIKIFKSPLFGDIRTAGTSEKPLFCLADVCRVLELQTNKVKKRLDARGWSIIPTPTYNQHGAEVMQDMTFIDEPNLYKCIFQSRKKEAEAFQEWVTTEVLPSIRRNGGYMQVKADETPEETMARALIIADEAIKSRDKRIKAQEEQIIEQAATISELRPKAALMQRIMSSVTLFTTTQVANQLGMTAQELNRKLEDCGIIYLQSGQWLLHSPYVRMGLHATRFVPITRSDGTEQTNAYTVWQHKGALFLQTLQTCNWNTRETLDRFGYDYKPAND